MQPNAKELVPKLIAIVATNAGLPEVVVGGLSAIRFMNDQNGIKEEFRNNEGLPLLISLFKSGNFLTKKTCLRFLGDLLTKNRTIYNGRSIVEIL